ncbi:MAG: hypothetical protein IT305_07090 [Chloroflexi bacterium]|nr:hypothetical protein [Chloroflexota bacterium]
MEHLLPAAALLVCLVLAASTMRRYLARHRTHEAIWSLTFTAFGLAAGAELYGVLFGWTPPLVRLYYLAGASLSVGFLAAGTLYLLVPRPLARAGLFVVLIQSVVMVLLVLRTPIDPSLVETAGWSALARDANVRALAITINALGTIVVVVGSFGSAYALWVRGLGGRAGGVALIGLGTLTVGMGGSLTRFGHAYLYGPMVVGLLVIYAGYRQANRRTLPAPPVEPPAATAESASAVAAVLADSEVTAPGSVRAGQVSASMSRSDVECASSAAGADRRMRAS